MERRRAFLPPTSPLQTPRMAPPLREPDRSSPAAALPTETLHHILQCHLERSSALEAQKSVWRLQRGCRAWHEAFEPVAKSQVVLGSGKAA